MMDGSPADLSMIDDTILLVKALPISEDYFDDIAKQANLQLSDFDDLQNIPDREMRMMFNLLNKIILFTMFNFKCE